MCLLMTFDTDDDIRTLFTEIGCIMEDASLIALVWSSTDNLDVRARFQTLSQAHREIGDLLLQIDDPA